MSTHLITGYAGHGHIKASDQGSFNAALLGNGEFVLERGEQLRCAVVSNNCVRIYDGDILMQGRHIIVDRDTYEDTAHSNGTAGYKRIDLIVMTYTKDIATGIETAGIEVIEGTPVTGTPTVPEHITGDILNGGASKHQMPLYKVTIDGLNMGTPVKMFKTVSTLETMRKALEADIDKKLEDVALPIVSDLDDMKLIENYGEYIADAKSVGEIAQSFQDGCSSIAAAITEMGVTTSSNASPATMAANIRKLEADVKYQDFTGTSLSKTAADLGASKIVGCGVISTKFSTSIDNNNWSYNFTATASYTDTSASGKIERSKSGEGSNPSGNFTATWRVFYV